MARRPARRVRGPALNRRPALLLAAAVLAGGLGVPSAAGAAAPVPTLFPSDRFTVRDVQQLTGRRVALPVPPDCWRRQSECDTAALLNRLDGFDLDPRVAIGFRRQVDLRRVTRGTVWVQRVAGGPRIGLERLVFSPATGTLYGHPEVLLEERTAYRLVVTAAVTGTAASTTFTTMSATTPLWRVRRMLDDGRAYAAAGIADRSLTFREAGALLPSVFPADRLAEVVRVQDRGDASALHRESARVTLSGAARVAFGSFPSPQFLGPDRVFRYAGTRRDPSVVGAERLGVVAVLPAGTPPAGGWPTVVFGPGLTRSRFDVLIAADRNAAHGIATVATDPAGHGYGPLSRVEVTTTDGVVVVLPGHGRGSDHDGDGSISASEGISAPQQPHAVAAVGLRDGLRQSAVDVLALVRALAGGVDVDGDLLPDLSGDGVAYYGQSLGAVYGTLAVATDPRLSRALLNVGGGPLSQVFLRGPAFRRDLATALHRHRPDLLNGGRNGFTESMPLPGEPPVTRPATGATAIQGQLSRWAWLQRAGDPLAAAPLLRLRRLPDVPAKQLLLQVAVGDRTVANPTSAALVHAGRLADVTTLYRADLTADGRGDPHGFLLDPGRVGKPAAQEQLVAFLADGSVVDPDGAEPAYEVPAADLRVLQRDNFPVPPARTPPPERPRV